jgi:hypothetical protein
VTALFPPPESAAKDSVSSNQVGEFLILPGNTLGPQSAASVPKDYKIAGEFNGEGDADNLTEERATRLFLLFSSISARIAF